ncbi:DUF2515 family protein [Bacillus massiliigorillae]|uniref:DUF2515 family protein n=1 Tax=Bacillus massiliigorillae TaxID=1243664 RepID=UPI0003A8608A|nr:DUF2515 family protein [Bacillus massiliigorillae]
MLTFSPLESNKTHQQDLISIIMNYTTKYNKDNISRTNAYFTFFKMYPEIKWAFLASMVSRNAGWNMCDLEGAILPKTLPPHFRKELFLTYETTNFLIFKDAFPQLLLYHYSTKTSTSLFHLNKYFSTSYFMCKEWELFWKERNENRLMTSLIINEQNVVQKPIIEGAFFQKKVFQSHIFLFQDLLHFSAVLFPTVRGELYGASAHSFRKLDERIYLGKVLANILFSSELFPHFYQFAAKTEHTGSREDYEQYFPYRKQRETPYLRTVYPVIDLSSVEKGDWEQTQKVKSKWVRNVSKPKNINITKWYEKKQKQFRLLNSIWNLSDE